MKDRKTKKLISIPLSLLKKIDRLAKENGMDRSTFICEYLKSGFIADEMREANREKGSQA